MKSNQGSAAAGTLFLVLVGIIVVAAFMFVGPYYRVWSQEKRGQADLAEARFNRQIAVEEADARAESARIESKGRLDAAKFEAQSNEALIDSLGGDPERLISFRMIDQLAKANVVYIPTEAGMPILEAGRSVPRLAAPPRSEDE